MLNDPSRLGQCQDVQQAGAVLTTALQTTPRSSPSGLFDLPSANWGPRIDESEFMEVSVLEITSLLSGEVKRTQEEGP